ncbi:hypothetical protein BV25DRAFT_660585 [Artomyces pyxidatus]|uniref:Uncharacterized protein n=1 Tax=Artomyces pyxidatus TaxID=48021 RepID=A0ACB8T084_9AGAM|nr:hypothetical protein BV25DRAFT_660585 [Artomyces pyxidatus]
MLFNVSATFFFTLAATLFSLAAASPLAVLQKRDVYVPPVLYPHAGTVWKVGEQHNVTWNNTSPPAEITNPKGQIYLRKGDSTLMNMTLASKFNLADGRTEVTVPDLTPGSDYRIVLFGDSGNWSPEFEITN